MNSISKLASPFDRSEVRGQTIPESEKTVVKEKIVARYCTLREPRLFCGKRSPRLCRLYRL